MKTTLSKLAAECAAETIEAIRNGSASSEIRQAYAMGLRTAQNERLAGARIETQTDFTQTEPSERTRAGETQGMFF
jgi:hypothetical protein